jgi:prepilin-type N-terminal cleavage/methylation domain-containing protein
MTVSKSNSEAGFSLLEILIVLSVVALMSSLMIAMMGQFRNLKNVDENLTQQALLQKIADHITSLLEQSEAIPIDVKPNIPVQFIDGKNNQVIFLTAIRSGARTSRLAKIAIYQEEESIIQTNTSRRNDVNEARTSKFVLLDKIASLKFKFLQKKAVSGAGPDWLEDWRQSAEFPIAIQVVITLKSLSGQSLSARSIAYISR